MREIGEKIKEESEVTNTKAIARGVGPFCCSRYASKILVQGCNACLVLGEYFARGGIPKMFLLASVRAETSFIVWTRKVRKE